MKLDPDFASAFDFEKAHGPIAVVTHFGISRVMTDDDVILVGKFDYPSEKTLCPPLRQWDCSDS